MRLAQNRVLTGALLALLIAGSGAALAHNSDEDGDDPVVDHSKTSQELTKLPRKPLGERAAVSIYQFRSAMQEVTPLAAADMFTTALVESGQFRVVERSQLNETVVREKQLNAAGQTTGTTRGTQLRGAQYLFEGTVSEANAGQNTKQGGINIGGLNLGGGKNEDTIAIDVRIIDAETGDVLDSIAVRKVIKSTGAGVGGTASFVGTVASMMGKTASPLTPDVNLKTSRKESVDKALRSCIDASVLELIKRLPAAAAAAG